MHPHILTVPAMLLIRSARGRHKRSLTPSTTTRKLLAASMTADQPRAMTSQPNCVRRPCADAPIDANANIAQIIQM